MFSTAELKDDQGVNESIDLYVTDLRLKAKTCKFGTCEFGVLTDKLIHDRIVCVFKSDQVRGRLLQEAELSLRKAIDTCRASEVSQTQLKSLGANDSRKFKVDVVNKTSSKSNAGYGHQPKQTFAHKPQGFKQPKQQDIGSQSLCRNCGQTHQKGYCPAQGKKCNFCHKLSHFVTCQRKTLLTFASDLLVMWSPDHLWTGMLSHWSTLLMFYQGT